jgi:hypothetical protein
MFDSIFYLGFMEKRLHYEGMQGNRGFCWKESKLEARICHRENIYIDNRRERRFFGGREQRHWMPDSRQT